MLFVSFFLLLKQKSSPFACFWFLNVPQAETNPPSLPSTFSFNPPVLVFFLKLQKGLPTFASRFPFFFCQPLLSSVYFSLQFGSPFSLTPCLQTLLSFLMTIVCLLFLLAKPFFFLCLLFHDLFIAKFQLWQAASMSEVDCVDSMVMEANGRWLVWKIGARGGYCEGALLVWQIGEEWRALMTKGEPIRLHHPEVVVAAAKHQVVVAWRLHGPVERDENHARDVGWG